MIKRGFKFLLLSLAVISLASCQKSDDSLGYDPANFSVSITWDAAKTYTDISLISDQSNTSTPYVLAKVENPKSPCTIKFPEPPAQIITAITGLDEVPKGVTISNNNAKGAVAILSANSNALDISENVGDNTSCLGYLYVTEDVTISGKVSQLGTTATTSINLEAKKGWNPLYTTLSVTTSSVSITLSTSRPSGKSEWSFSDVAAFSTAAVTSTKAASINNNSLLGSLLKLSLKK